MSHIMNQVSPNVLTIYQTKFMARWRWRLVAPNGEIIGASTEAYNDKRDCVNNIAQLFPASIMQNHHVIYDTRDKAAVLRAIEVRYG